MRLDANITNPDGFYASLIAANEDLTEDEASDFVIRLMLILANQIGDHNVLERCIQQALGNSERPKKEHKPG
jgi:Protein of unknown function (DUF2783)